MKATMLKNGTEHDSPERIAKVLATRRKNGTMNNRTKENIQKGVETRARNGTQPSSLIVIEKAKTTRMKNKSGVYLRLICPHCNTEAGKPNYTKYHGNACKMKR